MNYTNSLNFARQSDSADPLARFRERFFIPKKAGKDVTYFCGNSLGLQPKSAASYIQQELKDWADHGVEGHFTAQNPWVSYQDKLLPSMANLVGAHEDEVTIMNSLTCNLHLLLVSFYRPTPTRYKILCEDKAFPSDRYALESQIRFHGLNPDDALIELKPKEGQLLITKEDIQAAIRQHGDSLALVLFGGVNYYTGQAFDMRSATKNAHSVGALAGFDLAHAVGNIRLKLHKWEADFACWCSYKYLNSGPGGVAGLYVNERHFKKTDIPRFAGWWGNDSETRFKMDKTFQPAQGAKAWQLSNEPIFAMAALKASLDIFEEAGLDEIYKKSEKLTGYLYYIIDEVNKKQSHKPVKLNIITPKDPDDRGSQLSVMVEGSNGKQLFDFLNKNGVITDWRDPDVIRFAPVPLYNSYEDVWRFGSILEEFFFSIH